MRQIGNPTIVVRPASAADATPIIDLHFAAVHQSASAFYPAEAFYRRAGYEVLEYGIHRLGTSLEMACVKMKKVLAK